MDTDKLAPMAYDCIGLADAVADTLKSEPGATWRMWGCGLDPKAVEQIGLWAPHRRGAGRE